MKKQLVGQIQRPGERPQDVQLVVDERQRLSASEADAGIQWVDSGYDPGYLERYGGVADGTTDSTAALETANSVGRQSVRFYETGRTDVLSTYTGRHHFYIIRDAFVDRANLIGPANFASDGTQTESMLRLGRDPDNANGTQWRFRKVEGINFSGKLRVDNAISFGADSDYPNAFALGWEIKNCHFERCNIGIKKEHGNFGNRITNCSSSNGNFGYWAQSYPIRTEIGALGEASGQTVLTVLDTTGMNALDVVRILMDDATIHKTTIVTVDSATQITVADAIDDDAAAGNYVKAYHPDDTVPVTLAHPGNDTISHGEWSGNRKAAFYIDGQNAPGCGSTVFRDVIVETNPGFGIFIKDYNNAFTPVRLENVWFEGNATDTTVDLGDGFGNRTPKDIYLENVDYAIIDGCSIHAVEFIDSSVHLDHCQFAPATADVTITNTNNLSIVRVTNAHINGYGEEVSGAKELVIESVERISRELGDSVARMWRTPQLTPVSINEVHYGTILESDTGDNGKDWLGVAPASDVARDGFVEGNTYSTATQYTFASSSTYISPAVMSVDALTQNKWYVCTMELRVDSGLANLATLMFGSGYSLTRGDAESLLTEGEWATIGIVGLLDVNYQAGTIRPLIVTSVGGTCQISWGATQIVEFDSAQEACEFYNQNIHVYQHKSSKRVRRTDSAAKNNNTLADDTELVGWNLQAETWYQVEGYLIVNGDNTADWQAKLDFSNAAQSVDVTFDLRRSAVAPTVLVDTGSGTGAFTFGGAADHRIIVTGAFQANATTGGDVALQWAQGTTNAYDTKLLEGSWMRISKMHDEN
jgi:hypothetical protein